MHRRTLTTRQSWQLLGEGSGSAGRTQPAAFRRCGDTTQGTHNAPSTEGYSRGLPAGFVLPLRSSSSLDELVSSLLLSLSLLWSESDDEELAAAAALPLPAAVACGPGAQPQPQ